MFTIISARLWQDYQDNDLPLSLPRLLEISCSVVVTVQYKAQGVDTGAFLDLSRRFYDMRLGHCYLDAPCGRLREKDWACVPHILTCIQLEGMWLRLCMSVCMILQWVYNICPECGSPLIFTLPDNMHTNLKYIRTSTNSSAKLYLAA